MTSESSGKRIRRGPDPTPPKPTPDMSADPEVDDGQLPPTVNWVINGQLIIGEEPSSSDAARLIGAGVTVFVSLLEGTPAYMDEQRGHVAEAALRGGVPGTVVELASTRLIRVPISDQSCIAPEHIAALVRDLRSQIMDGRIVMVHCRGGHGRTGVVAIALVAALVGRTNSSEVAYSSAAAKVIAATRARPSNAGRTVRMPETRKQRGVCREAIELVLSDDVGGGGDDDGSTPAMATPMAMAAVEQVRHRGRPTSGRAMAFVVVYQLGMVYGV